jgi:predicted nucleic acid-binding protein
VIVLDASAVVDFLLDTVPYADAVADILRANVDNVHAPHLLDVEIGHALRRYVLSQTLSSERADMAFDHLGALAITRYPHMYLVRRALELRKNVSVYDGVYLALAEALDAPLVTRDAALAHVPGVQARVEVIR